MLFPDQRQDCKSIEVLWQNWLWENIKAVVGDKGYASSPIKDTIKSYGALPVIPLKDLWLPADADPIKLDNTIQELYAKRNFIERCFIERCFGRIKDNKRIAIRFDKLDVTFRAFIALALMKAFKSLC